MRAKKKSRPSVKLRTIQAASAARTLGLKYFADTDEPERVLIKALRVIGESPMGRVAAKDRDLGEEFFDVTIPAEFLHLHKRGIASDCFIKVSIEGARFGGEVTYGAIWSLALATGLFVALDSDEIGDSALAGFTYAGRLSFRKMNLRDIAKRIVECLGEASGTVRIANYVPESMSSDAFIEHYLSTFERNDPSAEPLCIICKEYWSIGDSIERSL